MTILVAATIPPYVMDREDTRYWSNWLSNPAAFASTTEDVDLFLSLEIDGRGIDVFYPLLDRVDKLRYLPVDYWSFSLSMPMAKSYTSRNRLTRICTGRNLISEYASQREDVTHILHLDADIRPADNLITRLLEMKHPIVGAHVPTYCLEGFRAAGYPEEWDVQTHMNTAGCLMVERDLFRKLRWRWDDEAEMTDDPCYHADAKALGAPTHVRHDTICTHYPEALPPMEDRGHDREIH